jgi:hypothetical protein
MNRAPCDNDLLVACDRLHGRVLRVVGAGLVIGIGWYVLVALRAGAA